MINSENRDKNRFYLVSIDFVQGFSAICYDFWALNTLVG